MKNETMDPEIFTEEVEEAEEVTEFDESFYEEEFHYEEPESIRGEEFTNEDIQDAADVEVGIEEEPIPDAEEVTFFEQEFLAEDSDNSMVASPDSEEGETHQDINSEYYEQVLAYLDDAPTVSDIQQLQSDISVLNENIIYLNENLVQTSENISTFAFVLIGICCALLGALIGSLVLSKIF